MKRDLVSIATSVWVHSVSDTKRHSHPGFSASNSAEIRLWQWDEDYAFDTTVSYRLAIYCTLLERVSARPLTENINQEFLQDFDSVHDLAFMLKSQSFSFPLFFKNL